MKINIKIISFAAFMKNISAITGFFLFISCYCFAQTDSSAIADSSVVADSVITKKPLIKKKVVIPRDSIILNNGDLIRGEIQSMDNGVLTMETDYSDEDLKIEWDKIDYIYANTYFFVTFSNGQRFTGNFVSSHKGKAISASETGKIEVDLIDIVYIKSLDKGFWNRLTATIDLGFNITKANNLRQLSINTKFSYLMDKWSADIYLNSMGSTQDEVDPINRDDAGLNFKYFLPRDKFLTTQISLLSNTEQKLDLRTTAKLGVGQFLLHNNKTYISFNTGLSFNNEKFTTDDSNRQSLEAYLGSEINLYNTGDLSLFLNATGYRSLTDGKRWRSDILFDIKYDLPFDFYVKLNLSANFDNKAVENASGTDFVIQTNFGWEFN